MNATRQRTDDKRTSKTPYNMVIGSGRWERGNCSDIPGQEGIIRSERRIRFERVEEDRRSCPKGGEPGVWHPNDRMATCSIGKRVRRRIILWFNDINNILGLLTFLIIVCVSLASNAGVL